VDVSGLPEGEAASFRDALATLDVGGGRTGLAVARAAYCRANHSWAGVLDASRSGSSTTAA